MIEIITEKIEEAEMSTSSDVDMNPTGKPKKKKREVFNVSDDCFHKFRNGKIKEANKRIEIFILFAKKRN